MKRKAVKTQVSPSNPPQANTDRVDGTSDFCPLPSSPPAVYVGGGESKGVCVGGGGVYVCVGVCMCV